MKTLEIDIETFSSTNLAKAGVYRYSETLTRRLVEKVTIFDEKIVVTLKSGLEMEVEA